MDSNRIKNLATGVREALRAEVSSRLDAVLAEGSRARLESARQVKTIEEDIAQHGRDEVVDRAAYTWFNRLCALRFMDARGYNPTPVVTPREGSTQPAILADAAQGVFDPEYEVGEDLKRRVASLLSGLTSSANAAEDAYSLLLRAICDHYAAPMGYLFAEDVASPLLMPQGLLAQGSILSRIVSEMDEGACSSVEVLGWLYQFYVAERKNEVFTGYKKGKKAQASDIAPATQLFTPEWIVRYMAENSLGRLWMLNNPDSELATSMDYYIAPRDDEPHVEVSSADEIRVLDPACGSGHILVYAFDLLFRMYEEEGWPTEDIPQMILENNLFGLEIDRRAAEIAAFALEMKARERDPRFFERDVDARIHVLEPVRLESQELRFVPKLSERTALLDAMAHLDEVGSLYVPDPLDELVLANELENVAHDGSLFVEAVIGKLEAMHSNVRALSQSFHCVIANPPYMGSNNMNPWLSGWMKENYPDEKSDLFAAFIMRDCAFSVNAGKLGFMSPYVWMFISSYEKLRRKLIDGKTITSLIQLEYSGFAEATVPICTFTLSNNRISGYQGGYIRLSNFVGAMQQAPKALEAIQYTDCGWFYRADAEDFKAIAGWPIAYWVSEAMKVSFASHLPLKQVVYPLTGMQTGDVNRFLRLWWELSNRTINRHSETRAAAKSSGDKWFPCKKGGQFQKWYGNDEWVINWKNDGEEIARNPGSVIRNPDAQFKESISWSKLSSSVVAMRYYPRGWMFDQVGSSIEGPRDALLAVLAFVNSSVAMRFFGVLSPTLTFGIGEISKLPLAYEAVGSMTIVNLSKSCIRITKDDWNSYESSWGFLEHPLVRLTRLADAFTLWESECRDRFDQLKANEEELNRIFACIYHMEDEVAVEVSDEKVSVRLADRARDARSLVSYAVGCLFGRYSTQIEGLVLANQGDSLDDFRAKIPDSTFLPDEDNVLPVLAAEWFDDDIVTGIRHWLAYVYGEETLDENITWLEKSIGKDLRTYLVKDFYADHLKTYQKRPIYWMFQSPKKSFQCLIYMHRYNEGTVGTVLTYIRSLEDKLQARLSSLESKDASAADLKAADKVRASIAELADWERNVIKPLADERITIDLDDGVKVNYNKFPKALAKVTGLSEWK